MKNFSKNGFTLIELLIVITIIGILAVGGINIYSSQIKKARDSKNIKNMKILDQGVQSYILDNGITIHINTTLNSIGRSNQFKEIIKEYIPNIYSIKHSSPKRNESFCASNVCGYRYTYFENTDQYNLYTQLETDKFSLPGAGGRHFKLGTPGEYIVPEVGGIWTMVDY